MGLGQKMPPFMEQEHSFREPGHQQYFEPWPLASHPSGQIYAGHSRDLEVRHQKMYFVRVIRGLPTGFRDTSGAKNLVAALT
jgi:hypothetical protein